MTDVNIDDTHGRLRFAWPWIDPARRDRLERVAAAGVAWSPNPIVAWRMPLLNMARVPEGVTVVPTGQWITAVCEAPDRWAREGDPDDVTFEDWFESVGSHPCHVVPELYCTCGFYAYKQPGARSRRPPGRHDMWQVELAGRVIEHDWGWRAQRMRYTELDVSAEWRRRVNDDLREQIVLMLAGGVASTGQLRGRLGLTSLDSAWLRDRLKAMARAGEIEEIRTHPNNARGGHRWRLLTDPGGGDHA